MKPEPTSQFSDREASRLRLRTIIRLRWVAVFGQALAVAFVHWGLGFQLPLLACFAIIALSAWLNLFLRIRFAPPRKLKAPYAALMLAYDILQLAALLYLTGGLQNPFAFLLLVPVTVSATTQPVRVTVLLGGLVVGLVTALAFFHMPLPWYPGERLELPLIYLLGKWVAIVTGLVFLAFYSWRISSEAHQMSLALTATEMVLAREQRLSALDGLAAAAAHELGTPLSTISLVAKELERACPKDGPLHEDVVLLRSQAQRCREILARLTRHRADPDLMHNQVPLSQLVEEAIEPHRNHGKEILVRSRPPKPTDKGPLSLREPVFQRNPGVIYGLRNIVENAVDFAQSQVEIRAEWTEDHIVLTISDDGKGFRHDLMEMLGEPYVTSRPAPLPTADGSEGEMTADRIGMGLGFFIAKTLLERSGAQLELWNKDYPDHGAVVRITWPRNKVDITLPETEPVPASRISSPSEYQGS